jgi:hypothetical protein
MTKARKDGAKDREQRRARTRDERKQDPTHHADLEPQHDQPWVPTNQLADRVRRSPRQ